MSYLTHNTYKYIFNTLFLPVLFTKINSTQNSYKMHNELLNSKLPSWPKTSLDIKLCFIKIARRVTYTMTLSTWHHKRQAPYCFSFHTYHTDCLTIFWISSIPWNISRPMVMDWMTQLGKKNYDVAFGSSISSTIMLLKKVTTDCTEIYLNCTYLGHELQFVNNLCTIFG